MNKIFKNECSVDSLNTLLCRKQTVAFSCLHHTSAVFAQSRQTVRLTESIPSPPNSPAARLSLLLRDLVKHSSTLHTARLTAGQNWTCI